MYCSVVRGPSCRRVDFFPAHDVFRYSGKDVTSCDGTICTLDDGEFTFLQRESHNEHSGEDFDEGSDLKSTAIFIGESWENNDGGIGGFIGENHQYFLYCGKKFPELAIAWKRDGTGPWEPFTSRQPRYSIPEFNGGKVPIVKRIWSTKVDGTFVLKLANNFGHAWNPAGNEKPYVQMKIDARKKRIFLTPIEQSVSES